MSFQLQINVPSNWWDYIPLPSHTTHTDANNYELVLQIPIPNVLSNLFTITTRFFGYDEPAEEPVLPAFASESIDRINQGNFSLCKEGVGGTYFIKNEDNSVKAVFKPVDEEPGASNNPKGLVDKPLLPPGQGALREVAACLLDGGFAGVPETCYIRGVQHTNFKGDGGKEGSLQKFINNEGLSSDVGSSLFDTENVHRIGVLDVRIFNLDRNGENMLIVKKLTESNESDVLEKGKNRMSYGLVPIDHSYSLPSIFSLDGAFFEWQYWSQAKKPFSPETLAYIHSIDIERDASVLRKLGITEDCIGTMVVCTLLLKRAVACNMTLFDIAELMTRRNLKTPSRLEEAISLAEKNAKEKKLPFLEEFDKILPNLLN